MKVLFLVATIFVLYGCAQTMTIDPERVGSDPANLTIVASELKGYVSVPLINYKVVNVELMDFPGCENERVIKKTDTTLGEATLTPKAFEQNFLVPSDTDLWIAINSEQNVAGNRHFCHMSLRFTPEKNTSYILDFKPAATIGRGKCTGNLKVKNLDGTTNPVANVLYPDLKKHDYWADGRHWCLN